MTNKHEPLEEKLQGLKEEKNKKIEIEALTRKQYELMDGQFQKVKNNKLLLLLNPTALKKLLRTTGAYILGRRNRKQLYSKAYKTKQASNDLKGYKHALYNEGFTEKALADLHALYYRTNNRYLKKAVAWELTLWYANKQTEDGATQALSFLGTVKQGENRAEMGRKIAIIEAECFVILGQRRRAKQLVTAQLKINQHPDLFLALSNIEDDSNHKQIQINKMLSTYSLEPIEFCSQKECVTYDNLRTKRPYASSKGPKISVILPAYNSEKGVRIAIESILNQTWTNIELIIVDDCSTDDTLRVIREYEKLDDRIIVMQTKQNSGPYTARNIALQSATGMFVTVNDADDWSHTQKLEIQANHLLEYPHVIANTSEQARLTEQLHFYRRGNPGKYIFSNMSSLLFRRREVLSKIGYWDSVRFAADGEFKRRLVQTFGESAVVDLETGPLSLPRQTATSLTADSAFGYNGFFMGARREYVESFSAYHRETKTLYYPVEQRERLFPVPEPMLPNRNKEVRLFDVVIVADFYDLSAASIPLILGQIEKNKQLGLKTALTQMASYRPQKRKEFNKQVRNQIDGFHVQMVVYGEEIRSKALILYNPVLLNEQQKYMPRIKTVGLLIIIDELPILEYNGKKVPNYNLRQCLHRAMAYFDKKGRWYPLNEQIRKKLRENHERELRSFPLAGENWLSNGELDEERYIMQLKNWLVDNNQLDIT